MIFYFDYSHLLQVTSYLEEIRGPRFGHKTVMTSLRGQQFIYCDSSRWNKAIQSLPLLKTPVAKPALGNNSILQSNVSTLWRAVVNAVMNLRVP